MKRLLASVLCAALALTMSPISLVALQAGQIAGTAMVDGKPLANVTVRLRNVDTGQLVGNTTANAQGGFSFAGLGPGNFIVETVGLNGTILGTSTSIALTAGAMAATGVAVSTSGAALAAAGGAGAAAAGGGAAAGGAAAGGGLGAALGSTAGLIGLAGAGILATTIIVVNNDASPSQ